LFCFTDGHRGHLVIRRHPPSIGSSLPRNYNTISISIVTNAIGETTRVRRTFARVVIDPFISTTDKTSSDGVSFLLETSTRTLMEEFRHNHPLRNLTKFVANNGFILLTEIFSLGSISAIGFKSCGWASSSRGDIIMMSSVTRRFSVASMVLA